MRSNNKYIFLYIIGFVLGSIIFMGLTLLFSSLHETSNEVKGLSKNIDILHTQNSNYKSVIESMKKQIVSYELENNELKDRISSYNKEIQELREPSVKEDTDLALLAQLIESESGNQSFEGKLAVGTVVMNRVKSDEFPDTIREVIFQKGQFSVVPNGTIYNKPSDESLKAAKEIMAGSRVLGSNVLYFYNPKLTSKSNWITGRKVTKTIGDHKFTI